MASFHNTYFNETIRQQKDILIKIFNVREKIIYFQIGFIVNVIKILTFYSLM